MANSSIDRIDAGEKYCFECGSVIRARAEICPECGVRQPMFRSRGTKNKVVAGLFGIFLGSFGVHKFYLGRPGLGVLYLLTFWTGIPLIVGFVEGLVYLATPDDRFEEKYG